MIPGHAVERTVLAWTRTWLGVGVCGLLLLRLGAGSPARVATILTVAAAALAAGTLAGRRRANRLRALAPTGAVDPAARAAAITAATTTLLGLAAAVLIATR